MEKPSLFEVIREKYKAHGLIGLGLMLLGTLIQERVLDFLNKLIDALFIFLIRIFSGIGTQIQNLIGIILMTTGFLILLFIVFRAQKDIDRRFEEIKKEHKEELEKGEGLQVINIYEHWIDQEKLKHINMILKNNHDAPLAISSTVTPVMYREFGASKWQATKYDHPVSFTWREWVFEPKKTETIRLAQAERDNDAFFVHTAMNNSHWLKDAGEYQYRLHLKARDENNKQYELHVKAFFTYYGGTHLEFRVEEIS